MAGGTSFNCDSGIPLVTLLTLNELLTFSCATVHGGEKINNGHLECSTDTHTKFFREKFKRRFIDHSKRYINSYYNIITAVYNKDQIFIHTIEQKILFFFLRIFNAQNFSSHYSKKKKNG